MKDNIHPDYHEVTVTCACGATFKTGTTKKGDTMKVDICNSATPISRADKNSLIPADV